MTNWIALLRGVNVGGHHLLPMKALVDALEPLGFIGAKTYIQSGNLIFQAHEVDSAALAGVISSTINTQFGFLPFVKVISREDYCQVVANNPFPEYETENEGKALHVFFLETKPLTFDRNHLNALQQLGERWEIVENAVYLYTPMGFHRSKLAAKLEKILGGSVTARNWRTVMQILALSKIE